MRIDNIEITNFGVFGENVKCDFSRYDSNDKVLIIGENDDAAGADSNGAGKSTLLNAISWVVFGRVPNDIASDDVIRRGTSHVNVALGLRDEEDRAINIVRSRKLKGSHELQWFIEGESQTQRTMKQTQLSILNYFGILENNTEYYSDFLNTTYFSVDAVKAFAGKKSNSRDRMDLISRFLNLEILERCTSKAKVLANAQKSDLKVVQGKIEFLRNKLDSGFNKDQVDSDILEYLTSQKQLKADLKKLRSQIEVLQDSAEIKDQVDEIDDHITHYNKELSTIVDIYNKQIEDLKNKLSNSSVIKERIEKQQQLSIKYSDKLKDKDLQAFNIWLNNGKAKISTATDSILHLTKQLDDHHNCPHCDAAVMITNNKIEKFEKTGLETTRQELIEKAEEMEVKWQAKLKEYNKLHDTQTTLNSINSDIKNDYRKLEGTQTMPDEIIEIKEKIKNQKADTKTSLKQLEKKKLSLNLKLRKFPQSDITLRDVQNEIDTTTKQIENVIDEVARLRAQLESRAEDEGALTKFIGHETTYLQAIANANYWVEGFPAIRRWMIESFLPTFEQQTNSYLNQMEVGMRCRFDTLTEKKTQVGQYKEQFDLSIIDENNEKRDLETYSQGETKRIGICVGFALRELTLTKGYSNFNFLMMDEVIDSLDETGIGEFFNLLNNISGMKMLITHNTDLKTRFANIITIRKQDGISTIVQN
tara:strand:- start:1884 stop:3992 length:2109 start_codon:yes stop_codon:yes gene_type:complete